MPKQLQEIIKKFRKNVLKQADAHLYIKITSSFIDWEDSGEPRLSYHWIKIGSAKKDFVLPEPTEKAITGNINSILPELRAQRLAAVNQQFLGVFSDSKLRVNYQDDKVIIVSDWKDYISEEDGHKIATMEAAFNNGTLDISDETAKHFCRYAPEYHRCPTKAKDDRKAKAGSDKS